MPGLSQRSRVRTNNSGFTLVELLVALTLLGFLFVALLGGVRFGTRAWDVGTDRSEELNRLEATQGLIRRLLTQASLPEHRALDEVLFRGEPDRLEFLAPQPSPIDVGGLYRVAIFVSEGDGEKGLNIAWQLRRDASDGGELSRHRVLLKPIENLTFRYFGDSEEGSGSAEWHDRWEDQLRLPDLLSVRIVFPEEHDRYWPELIVAPALGTHTVQQTAP